MLFLFMIACGDDPTDTPKDVIPPSPTDDINEPTNEIDCEDTEQLEPDDQVGDDIDENCDGHDGIDLDGDGGDADQDDAHIALIGDNSGGTNVVGSDANEAGVSGQIWLYNPASTSITHGTYDLCYQANTPENLLNVAKGGFARMSAADVDAIRILFSSGNIESGTINAYGVTNA